jgi:hypothetical protein
MTTSRPPNTMPVAVLEGLLLTQQQLVVLVGDTQDLRGSGSRIEVSMRQQEDPRWGCSNAMTVGNHVVVEGRVCLLSKDTAAAVNNLLDQVVAKVPQ